jgi:hypothetical protein
MHGSRKYFPGDAFRRKQLPCNDLQRETTQIRYALYATLFTSRLLAFAARHQSARPRTECKHLCMSFVSLELMRNHFFSG